MFKNFFKNYFIVRKYDIFHNTDKKGVYHGGMNPIVEDVIGVCFAILFYAFNIDSWRMADPVFRSALLFLFSLLGTYCLVRFLPKLIVDSYLLKALKRTRKQEH